MGRAESERIVEYASIDCVNEPGLSATNLSCPEGIAATRW
jgi:hypothetical protein